MYNTVYCVLHVHYQVQYAASQELSVETKKSDDPENGHKLMFSVMFGLAGDGRFVRLYQLPLIHIILLPITAAALNVWNIKLLLMHSISSLTNKIDFV